MKKILPLFFIFISLLALGQPQGQYKKDSIAKRPSFSVSYGINLLKGRFLPNEITNSNAVPLNLGFGFSMQGQIPFTSFLGLEFGYRFSKNELKEGEFERIMKSNQINFVGNTSLNQKGIFIHGFSALLRMGGYNKDGVGLSFGAGPSLLFILKTDYLANLPDKANVSFQTEAAKVLGFQVFIEPVFWMNPFEFFARFDGIWGNMDIWTAESLNPPTESRLSQRLFSFGLRKRI